MSERTKPHAKIVTSTLFRHFFNIIICIPLPARLHCVNSYREASADVKLNLEMYGVRCTHPMDSINLAGRRQTNESRFGTCANRRKQCKRDELKQIYTYTVN